MELSEVSQLARLLVDADAAVERQEHELSVAKENARRLREEALPSAMMELGLERLDLSDGTQITTGEDVYCSITEAMRERAHSWLDDNGFGGLIKTDIVVPFGRDDEGRQKMKDVVWHLAGLGLSIQRKEAVHPGTLKAFLKEQLREGRPDLPLQLFGARPVTVAKVKLPKG